ncbi:uncharacterized protein [Cardiocondyla obscurior]|uniref:uncharacterized protein n=1 Tax=Cardiocondyla obscurior TaxID=286306 RepID=UPI0039656088
MYVVFGETFRTMKTSYILYVVNVKKVKIRRKEVNSILQLILNINKDFITLILQTEEPPKVVRKRPREFCARIEVTLNIQYILRGGSGLEETSCLVRAGQNENQFMRAEINDTLLTL